MQKINVFDFDGTIFGSPLPRKDLLNDETHFKKLKYSWFQNEESLSLLTNEELDNPSIWNQDILDRIYKGHENADINVLLTGRKSSTFSEQVFRILSYKGLRDLFIFISLKPKGSSTFEFKTNFVKNNLLHFDEYQIDMYDDMEKYVNKYNKFFEEQDINGICHHIDWTYPYAYSKEKEMQAAEVILKREGINIAS